MVNSLNLAPFAIQYRAYYTKFYCTAIDMPGGLFTLGVTETCLILKAVFLYCAIYSNAGAIDEYKLPFGLVLSQGQLIAISCGSMSI